MVSQNPPAPGACTAGTEPAVFCFAIYNLGQASGSLMVFGFSKAFVTAVDSQFGPPSPALRAKEADLLAIFRNVR